MQSYFDNTQKPWGQLFYKIIWNQLSFAESMNILDFGSGFGITADYLARSNTVTAIEPNKEMCDRRIHENNYLQITGDISYLKKFSEGSFDIIICHNVLEYIEDKETYIKTFSKLLKSGGKLSLIKHNHVGRIISKAVFENNPKSALQLIEGQPSIAQNFGEIRYYDLNDIVNWSDKYSFKIIDLCGIRTFFGLNPNNEIKFNEAWQNSMLELEFKVCRVEEYRKIAFYNHILLEKAI